MSTNPTGSRRLVRLVAAALLLLLFSLAGYGLLAYEFVPAAWRFVERRHPALDTVGTRAFTGDGIPGDPFNLAFLGTERELQELMVAAGWLPADPITLRSSLRIAYGSVAGRPYPYAPVSDLFVNRKRQDLAFEQAEGGDPSKRHHVRFWLTEPHDLMDRPLWIGAATYDASVGVSRTTGQITHHIAAEIDRERDKLVSDLGKHHSITVKWIDDFHREREGRNGGGDRFITDGKIAIIDRVDATNER